MKKVRWFDDVHGPGPTPRGGGGKEACNGDEVPEIRFPLRWRSREGATVARGMSNAAGSYQQGAGVAG